MSRPVVSIAVLGIVVLILVLILAAAYHGSNGTGSSCGPPNGLLRRVTLDAAAPRADALQRDDDDVNDVINAGSHPALDSRLLPVASNLGRVVTDLQDHMPADPDLAALRTALAAATAACSRA